MKMEIHSFDSIQSRAEKPFAPKTALISIGDPDAPPPELVHKPEHILRMVFDDITLQEVNERYKLPEKSEEWQIEFLLKYNISIFNDTKAQQIAGFVLKHKPDILICQCQYGQSRSAGCAAAVSEYFYSNGIDIFADERYYPNKLVYHKVLRALRASSLQ